ncbi:WD40 repeat-like protein [Eremomyces bilateralis CBS 781.70]|uniref:WD40 repeat-like protein n=1 Tax=Eremomyces bilateralis CBS 781.70 TaxID=1392243 RepID=A0A6G1GCE0_9PEZI|nr:WD40 repeat-like protein [Eremomyces bilateralis CBS 781.70]KAF1815571.1 WD40 repeat-like protein [Eremomyces bilateralis CBS 781.70]
MSSFFSVPASQRKRKRPEGATSKPSRKQPRNVSPSRSKRARDPAGRDESISGSESDLSGADDGAAEYESSVSDSEIEGETAAERRLRLAERYLENIKQEVETTGVGFDAEDVDRDLIADRLKEDVAGTKGKIYKFVANELDIEGASHMFFRHDNQAVLSVSAHPPYIYATRKDGSVVKWELPSNPPAEKQQSNMTPRRRPIKRICGKGRVIKPEASETSKPAKSTFLGHKAAIVCSAISPSGEFLATGGMDNKLVIWSTKNLRPIKVFSQHRDSVTGLAFRQTISNAQQSAGGPRSTGGETLYSSSADRTLKVWNVSQQSSGYIETLFGHQDVIMDVDAPAIERCVSVGARDRTARLWKVAEESQLVFRGGGVGAIPKPGKLKAQNIELAPELLEKVESAKEHHEGSIDRVTILDNELFVTGADNGAISLWSIHKKKALYTYPLAHGLDPPITAEEYYVEEDPKEKAREVSGSAEVPVKQAPRGITALKALPLSDVFVTGSWDGFVRAWKIRGDRRGFDPVGIVGTPRTLSINAPTPATDADSGDEDKVVVLGSSPPADPRIVHGLVTDLAVFEQGDRNEESLFIVASVAKEQRMGRWHSYGTGVGRQRIDGKNGCMIFEVGRHQKSDLVNH